MRRFTRTRGPEWLLAQYLRWGWEYEERRPAKWAGRRWQLQPGKRGEPINHALLPLLREMTDTHCSYCDGYPMGNVTSDDTIDHFKPKADYPLSTYEWDNLYLSCRVCQQERYQGGRPRDRLRVYRRFARMTSSAEQEEEYNELPYRFFLDLAFNE